MLLCLFLQAFLMLLSQTLSRIPSTHQTTLLMLLLLQRQAAAAAATAQAASPTMLPAALG
jgi:hypothetical protein